MTAVFFYGLFMDPDLLRAKGFEPSDPVMACVEDFGLRIGERATLVPAPGEQAWGTVMSLTEEALCELYGGDGVEDYVPEPVMALTVAGDEIATVAYNLPEDKLAGENREYLAQLLITCRQTGLPDAYIAQLERLA